MQKDSLSFALLHVLCYSVYEFILLSHLFKTLGFQVFLQLIHL